MSGEGESDPAADRTTGAERRRLVRDLGWGSLTVAFLIWITFSSTEGFVELATLAVTVGLLIWVATVEPERLMDGPRRPSLMLLTLGGLAAALVLTASLLLQTGTLLFVALLMLVVLAVGLIRALALRYRSKPEM